jgi:hypothetical protein
MATGSIASPIGPSGCRHSGAAKTAGPAPSPALLATAPGRAPPLEMSAATGRTPPLSAAALADSDDARSTRPVRLTRKSGDPAGVAVGADSADGGLGVVRGMWSLGTCRGRSSLGCSLTQQGVTAQGTNEYSSALEGARGYSRVLGDTQRYSRVLGDTQRYSRVLAVLDVPRRPSSGPPPGFSPHACATPACRHSS